MVSARSSPAIHTARIYNFSSVSAISTWILPSFTNFSALMMSSVVTSRKTSRRYSDFPMRTANATAVSIPTRSVPGIPTPIAFFSIFRLRYKMTFSTGFPRVSCDFATASPIAPGSVQPNAGEISCFINSK